MPGVFLVFLKFFKAVREGLREPEFRALSGSVLAAIGLGTWFYHAQEGWSWLDSLYFTVITLTTIGYGDLSPSKPLTKVFTIFFIFAGLGLFSAFILLLAERFQIQAEETRDKLRANKEKKRNG